jgi:hypothetical protein
VDIRGAGFGSGKGKVLIGGLPIKISDWTETEIRGTLTKVPPPDVASEVTVQLKVPKGAKIVESGAFTARGPEVRSVEPGSGVSGGTNSITIHGRFFSTKKGKVTLERGDVVKSCKVLKWEMEASTGESEIQFLVPKGLSPGEDYTLRVTNKLGSDTMLFRIVP